MDLSRRDLLKAAPLAVVGTTLGLAQPAHAALPLVKAHSAQDLWRSYGMCTHPNFGGVWRDTDAWFNRFESLNAHYMRGMYGDGIPANDRTIVRSRQAGTKMMVTVTPATWTQSREELLKRLRHINSHSADVVNAIEGVNEPNGDFHAPRVTNWAERTLEVQKTIWNFVQAEMPHIAVIGPSLHATRDSSYADHMKLGNMGLGRYMDWAGAHRYFGGRYPNYLMDERIRWNREAFGKPTWVSETGYRTSVAGKPAPDGTVPERIAAKYGPLCMLEFFTRGARAARYELLDDPDTSGVKNEAHTGLWYTPSNSPGTWREKPEAGVMRSFLRSFEDKGPSYNPADVRLGVDKPSGVKQLVVRRRDGNAELLLKGSTDLGSDPSGGTERWVSNSQCADTTAKRSSNCPRW